MDMLKRVAFWRKSWSRRAVVIACIAANAPLLLMLIAQQTMIHVRDGKFAFQDGRWYGPGVHFVGPRLQDRERQEFFTQITLRVDDGVLRPGSDNLYVSYAISDIKAASPAALEQDRDAYQQALLKAAIRLACASSASNGTTSKDLVDKLQQEVLPTQHFRARVTRVESDYSSPRRLPNKYYSLETLKLPDGALRHCSTS